MRIAKELEKLTALPVQGRSDLGDDPVYGDPIPGCPCSYAGHLTVEIALLIGGGSSGVYYCLTVSGRGLSLKITDQYQLSHLHRRDRQGSLSKPPIGGLGVDALEPGPFSKIHHRSLSRRGVTTADNPRI
jgi:hypothetical protein